MDVNESNVGDVVPEREAHGNEELQTFEQYIEAQPEKVKSLYEKHVTGLKGALESERSNRRKLSDQLKELTPKVEKGSELESKLAETVRLLEEAEQRSAELNKRAMFAEQAIRPDVGCSNIKACYALAVSENLFTDKGEPKWAELRSIAPELFRSMNKQTDGGAQKPAVTNDINAAIRRAAGL